MFCVRCGVNRTDSTSGVCGECFSKPWISPPPDEEHRRLSREALDSLKKRVGEDIDSWAKKLGMDAARFND